MNSVWAFLADPVNREILAWLGGGLAAVAGGIWTVLTFFLDRRNAGDGAEAPGPGSVNIRVSSGLSGGQTILLVLVVAGAVLMAAGLFGGRIDAVQSVVVDGDIQNSTITIQGETDR